MNWLVLLQIVLSVGYVWYLVESYSSKTVPPYVKGLVFSTWLLSFGIVLILPLDIYYSISADEPPESSSSILLVWKIVYWMNFIITWLLLPIAQQYELAGQFEWKAKLKRSLLNNLTIYGVFALFGVLFLVYLFIRGDFQMQQLTTILMAASNVFGMVLVVILLSHGIVEIPRKLWREKKYEGTLTENQYNASLMAAEKEQLISQLEAKVREIMGYQRMNGKTFESETVLALVPEGLLWNWSKNIPQVQNIDLIAMHKEVKRLVLDLARLQTKWQSLMLETFRIEDILKDLNSINHQIQSTLFTHYNIEPVNNLVWLWYCRIKLIVYPVLCVALAIFAAAVVLGQVSVFSAWFSEINLFRLVHHLNSFLAIDICMLIPLFYIAFCVFYGLFKMKLAGYYGLYQNHTDAPSLIFAALNCSRVSTALCYNFLQLVNVEDSAFIDVMGTADIVPVFGRTFNIIFPMLLLLLIVFNAFDIYSKVFKAVGLQKFDFDEDNPSQQSLNDGRKRLLKARADLETKILNSRNKNLAQYRSYQMNGKSMDLYMINKGKPSFDNLDEAKTYDNKCSSYFTDVF